MHVCENTYLDEIEQVLKLKSDDLRSWKFCSASICISYIWNFLLFSY